MMWQDWLCLLSLLAIFVAFTGTAWYVVKGEIDYQVWSRR